MTVGELIEELKKYPQHIPVCYECYSEYCALDPEDIDMKLAQHVRPDRWVHGYRSDKPAIQWLVLPGN